MDSDFESFKATIKVCCRLTVEYFFQGRVNIIEAHLRKGRGAIGAYGKEKSGPTAGKGARKAVDSEEEEEQEFKEKLQQWKRTGTGTGAQPKKVKYVYKTADQVLLQAYYFFLRFLFFLRF